MTVYAERQHGEAEAINRELTSPNILQVLPVEVITSLPNTNIADALGRLPSVTLERDEGEGKYVQIRGLEPRLSNVTVNGVNVPSSEAGVRQIKLDSIPANLVESVEINKTLSANQDGDAIGGSVNLVTKTASEKPTLYINGIGGYTPIVGGRSLTEMDATIGQRFGASKKFGVLFGASYDWNGRGIDDIEPGIDTNDFGAAGGIQPVVPGIDLREYRYYRERLGFAGSVDYKLSDGGGLYLRGLYSHFNNSEIAGCTVRRWEAIQLPRRPTRMGPFLSARRFVVRSRKSGVLPREASTSSRNRGSLTICRFRDPARKTRAIQPQTSAFQTQIAP